MPQAMAGKMIAVPAHKTVYSGAFMVLYILADDRGVLRAWCFHSVLIHVPAVWATNI